MNRKKNANKQATSNRGIKGRKKEKENTVHYVNKPLLKEERSRKGRRKEEEEEEFKKNEKGGRGRKT